MRGLNSSAATEIAFDSALKTEQLILTVNNIYREYNFKRQVIKEISQVSAALPDDQLMRQNLTCDCYLLI